MKENPARGAGFSKVGDAAGGQSAIVAEGSETKRARNDGFPK